MRRIYYRNRDELDAALTDFRILFAYHSNRIENEDTDYHDTRDVFENGKVYGYTGDPRTLFEIQNQRDCYYLLLDRIVAREPLSISLIREIHFELTKGTYDARRYIVNGERPGEFKHHDYVTGRHEVGSYPEDVEQDLQDLISEIIDNEGKDVLTIAAYLHACFENIHPFADGNGRVGRTLLNYYLLTHNVSPVIIYEEDRKEYYKSLERFDTDADLQPLKDFIVREQEKTWTRERRKAVSLKDVKKTL